MDDIFGTHTPIISLLLTLMLLGYESMKIRRTPRRLVRVLCQTLILASSWILPSKDVASTKVSDSLLWGEPDERDLHKLTELMMAIIDSSTQLTGATSRIVGFWRPDGERQTVLTDACTKNSMARKGSRNCHRVAWCRPFVVS